MEYTVKIYKKGEVIEKKVEAGTNLLTFLRKSSIDVHASCGGKGTCGKCKIRITGLTREPSNEEKSFLGDKNLAKGYRLACYHKINSDLDIYTDKMCEKARIVTETKENRIEPFPIITKQCITLDAPDMSDQRPDLQRVADVLKKQKISHSIRLLREIPRTLRQNNFKVTLVCTERKLIAVETGDTTRNLFGISVDIGTTTVVAYLIDLVSGEQKDVYSVLNPQRKFGADVLARIEYTSQKEDALKEVHKLTVKCINDMIRHLVKRAGIKKTDIYSVVFVGNTTMVHLFMGVSPANIGVSPFIPVTTQMQRFKAHELGIGINEYSQVVIFPSVSAYIGADTVAAVLSSSMYKNRKISLLIDIGTNGEMVLGNSKWLYACSTAAGPAFEGANIRNGVGSVNGAIDKVAFRPSLKYSTIGGEKAIGICGSGLVDVAAGMLTMGVINGKGTFTEGENAAKLSREIKKRLLKVDGKSAFLLVNSEDCNSDTDIVITQKDVRELQNAKAAIAAGIKILARNAGIEMKDIENVYLAGGFGSYVEIENALRIGLIPLELKGKIQVIGNAAGAGAIEGLLSVKMLKKAEEIKEQIRYVELSVCPDFMEKYIECMDFQPIKSDD